MRPSAEAVKGSGGGRRGRPGHQGLQAWPRTIGRYRCRGAAENDAAHREDADHRSTFQAFWRNFRMFGSGKTDIFRMFGFGKMCCLEEKFHNIGVPPVLD